MLLRPGCYGELPRIGQNQPERTDRISRSAALLVQGQPTTVGSPGPYTWCFVLHFSGSNRARMATRNPGQLGDAATTRGYYLSGRTPRTEESSPWLGGGLRCG